MIFANFVEALQKQSVGQLHDVRFVYRGDLLAVFAQRMIESEVRNAGRSLLSNNLQTFNDAGNNFVLETRIQTFSVLAHHH